MDAVCENEEHKEHNLESGEGCIGRDYNRGSGTRCEDRRDEVGEEGCHGR